MKSAIAILVMLLLPILSISFLNPIPQVAAATGTLQGVVRDDFTSKRMSGVSISIYYQSNGSLAGTATTNSTGNFSVSLATGIIYRVLTSIAGYDDDLIRNLNFAESTAIDIYLSQATYSGTVSSGAYTLQAHYNPGDSGKLNIWVYNQNNTYSISIVSGEIQFPWFVNYGSGYSGNASLTGLPTTVQPRSGVNLTAEFTVPNDGRITDPSLIFNEGRVYLTVTVSAWKTQWIVNSSGTFQSQALTTATFDGHHCPSQESICSALEPYFVVPITTPTQDTTGIMLILEILLGVFVVNVIFTVLTWSRLKSPLKA